MCLCNCVDKLGTIHFLLVLLATFMHCPFTDGSIINGTVLQQSNLLIEFIKKKKNHMVAVRARLTEYIKQVVSNTSRKCILRLAG